MEEELVYGFTSDNTAIPIWEAADISGLSVEEIRSSAETIIVKYEIVSE